MTEPADWYRSTLNLAKRLHAGQVDRGGRPYWRHLENVAHALVERWPDATKSEIQAALLHDALEDTSATATDLRTQGPGRASVVMRTTSFKAKRMRPHCSQAEGA